MYEYYITYRIENRFDEILEVSSVLKTNYKLNSVLGIRNARQEIIRNRQAFLKNGDVKDLIITWFKLLEKEE